jgi:hypothetical protein
MTRRWWRARLDDPAWHGLDPAPAAADLGGGCLQVLPLSLSACVYVCMCGGGGVRQRTAAPSLTPAPTDLGGGRLWVLPLCVCARGDGQAVGAVMARRWGRGGPCAFFVLKNDLRREQL